MSSDLAEMLDLSRYVPVNYPGVVAYKYAMGCPRPKQQCPKVPCYAKEFFCAEWGQNFKCMCPQKRSYPSPFRGVKDELASFDYFTRLPDNPNRKHPYPQYQDNFRYRTMAERYGLDEVHDCPKVAAPWSRLCPENQKRFNLLHKDTVCGLCIPPHRAPPPQMEPPIDCCEDQAQSSPEDMFDLPFCVKVGCYQEDTEKNKQPVRPRTGVRACLEPASFHDIQSVHRDAYRDFFKLKTRKELDYYRSPLAIDTRRPPLTLPSDKEKDMIVSGPMFVNALPLVMRPKGGQKLPRNLGPNFEVIVQGPICI